MAFTKSAMPARHGTHSASWGQRSCRTLFAVIAVIFLVLNDRVVFGIVEGVCNSDDCSGDDSDVVSKAKQREAAVRIMEAYFGSSPDTLVLSGGGDTDAKAQRAEFLNSVIADAEALLGHNSVFSDDYLNEILVEAARAAAKKAKERKGSKYVDRYVKELIHLVEDPDCMEREFDLKDDNFNTEDAVEVFKKCKLLVMRNVFDTDFLMEYRKNFTNYVHGINTGAINPEGTTSNAESYYLHSIDDRRWEIILPKLFAHPKLLANRAVLDVLMDNRILGPDLALHSLGTALAEPGANGQRWHKDNDYLFSGSSFETHGIGGHDLPSYSVTMMVPLLPNMTHAHGPTEFCMGSSLFDGLPNLDDAPFYNKSLTDEIQDWMELCEIGIDASESCPPRFWRMPVLGFGDLLLFDYQIYHRGGQNTSPDLRAIMYMTYSRFWYKDSNFQKKSSDEAEGTDEEERVLMQQLMETARFAEPNSYDCVGDSGSIADCWSGDAATTLERIPAFLPKRGAQEFEDQLFASSISAFIVSNHDIGVGVQIVLVDKKLEKLGVIKKGQYIRVEAKVGSVIEARVAGGKIIKSWTVLREQGQLVVSSSTWDQAA